MSPRTPLEPPELAGYDYLDRLGSGGFSDVFLYERHFPKQKVAIKVLSSESLGADGRARFTAEANVMASLSTHPYIVAIYQADISPEGHPYLVMEYYPRPNFNVRARTERFSVDAVLRAGIQVAAAVETAHRNGVLHRDIKPANILTSDYGRPGLTDFGIAVAADKRSEEAEGMSIPWSPPEVVAGSGLTDERADVYSLGATLYTLLAARSPFEVPGGSNRSIDLIDRIRRANPVPLGRGDVPDSLWRLLLQTMSRDPDNRPASAAELARSLQVIEVEQRFDMTPFEVSEGHEPAPQGDPIDADAGSTRVKGVGIIQSQVPEATSSTVSHDAFRPGETVARTTKRDAGAPRPAASAPKPGFIADTPYVPPATPAPPVVTASKPAPLPTASSYAAPQPVATPTGGASRATLIAIAAGVVAVLAIAVAALFATGTLGGDEQATTTTTEPAEVGQVTGVRVEPTGGTGEAGSTSTFDVSWQLPDGFNPATDVVRVEVNGRPVEETPGTTAAIESSTDPPCVELTVIRDGEAQGDGVTSGCPR